MDEPIAVKATEMTLRDYFASGVMSTILNKAHLPTKELQDEWLPIAAELAYNAADAMMEQRNK